MLLEEMVMKDMIDNGFNPNVEGDVIDYWAERLS
jgi:hypothetical protein